MNKFSVNYDTQKLIVTYKGQNFEFDLKDGDVGDYWNSFSIGDETFDINFYQENDEQKPSVSVYELRDDDGTYTIDTSEYEVISEYEAVGDMSKYF